MSGIIKIPKDPKIQPTPRSKKPRSLRVVRGTYRSRNLASRFEPLTRVQIASTTRIAQLSDLHLTGAVGIDYSYRKFLSALRLIKKRRVEFLLLTGDLVNDGNLEGYDWLFEQLDHTGIKYAAIAGNHDVTHEHNAHLPFEKRTFSPVKMDSRLQDCATIKLGNWQLLLLNSTIAGQTGGKLTEQQLDWINTQLTNHHNPTLIALHHHPVAVQSRWIDEYKLTNGAELLAILHQHSNAKVVICGHIHQAHDINLGNTTLYTTPAISRQFLPFADDFALDTTKTAGIRLIRLYDTGKFDSQVLRLPR